MPHASHAPTITLDSAGPVVGAITATPNSCPEPPDDDSHPGVGQPLGLVPAPDQVLDAAGGLVKSLPRTVTCSPAGTTTSVVWDGRNAANVPVPAGTYTIEVAATDRAGNAGAISRGTVVAQ